MGIYMLKPKGFLDKLEPALILPEITEPQQIKKVWWRGELKWLDSDHYVLASQAGAQTPIAINTELVKLEEVKSYQDLLAPKWKENMIMQDPTMSGFAQTWTAVAGIT